MKLDRYWIYPRVRNIGRVIPYVFLGALIGGAYGAVHDQLTYSVSPEYFTAFKFHQFHFADVGLCPVSL